MLYHIIYKMFYLILETEAVLALYIYNQTIPNNACLLWKRIHPTDCEISFSKATATFMGYLYPIPIVFRNKSNIYWGDLYFIGKENFTT